MGRPRRAENVNDAVERLHLQAISGLERSFRDLDARAKEGEDVTVHIANVARALAALTAVIRKRETHLKTLVGAMSGEERDALVRAYVAQQPRDRRQALKDWLDSLDEDDRLIP